MTKGGELEGKVGSRARARTTELAVRRSAPWLAAAAAAALAIGWSLRLARRLSWTS